MVSINPVFSHCYLINVVRMYRQSKQNYRIVRVLLNACDVSHTYISQFLSKAKGQP